MNKIRCLLLVEGNADHEAITREKLKESSIEVEDLLTATSLAQAINLLMSQPIDVILLELDLTDSKSIDTLKAVRALTDAALVVLVGSDNEMLGVDCLRAGADDFLLKKDMTQRALRQAIVLSMTRREIRLTACSMRHKLAQLEAAANGK
jgi:DNA-binding NarL/FixJ family response regulator